MPLAARADSEYFGGALGSSTSAKVASDDEHSPSSLRHSEEARVENPVGDSVPELSQRGADHGEVSSVVAVEDRARRSAASARASVHRPLVAVEGELRAAPRSRAASTAMPA